jgi:hypothetical protein
VKFRVVPILIHGYRWLIRLYPVKFRDEFEDEMTNDFAAAVRGARRQGIRSTAAVWFRELRDLPLSLARAYWQSLPGRPLLMKDYRKPDRILYLGWVAVTATSLPIGFIVSFIITFLIMQVIGNTIQVGDLTAPTEDVIMGYYLVPILGLSIGCLQWFVLRRYLPRMGWWILATCLGMLLALEISDPLRSLITSLEIEIDSDYWDFILTMILIGGSIGLLQWFVLRKHVTRASWWIPANVIGWILSFGAVFVMTRIFTSGNASSTFMEIAAMALQALALALIPAIVTSITLWLLLNPTKRGSAGQSHK